MLLKNEQFFFSIQENKSTFTKIDILKYLVYYILVYSVFFYSVRQEKFIYFQF